MKEFVPYDIAIELKELGFDEECFGYYRPSKEIEPWLFNYKGELKGCTYKSLSTLLDNNENKTLAPTFSQAFRWFREKHSIRNAIIPNWVGDNYIVIIEGRFIEEGKPSWFDKYEEAEIECLKKLIQIVKEKQ